MLRLHCSWTNSSAWRRPGWPLVSQLRSTSTSTGQVQPVKDCRGVVFLRGRWWCNVINFLLAIGGEWGWNRAQNISLTLQAGDRPLLQSCPDRADFLKQTNQSEENSLMQVVKPKGLLLEEAGWCGDFNPIFSIRHLFRCPHKVLQTNLHTGFKSCLRETEANFPKIYLVAFKVVFFLFEGSI